MDFIPAGYTSVAQLVDMGINAPLKKHCKRNCDAWLMTGKYILLNKKNKTTVPKQHVIAGWVSSAWQHIEEEMVQATWCHIAEVPEKANKAG